MPDLSSAPFRAARIECALQERTISTQSAVAQSRWFAFFIESGHAVAETPTREIELSGPALHWGPLDAGTRLRIAAGSAGHYLFLSDSVLNDAIGTVAEAADLRLFAQGHAVASFDRADTRAGRLDRIFARIAAEAGSDAFGTEIAIAAYVRLILIFLWRSLERERPDTAGHRRAEINRFRNLVEAHFRARWKARDYAEKLGMSYDRLHDLCVRSVGKPPAQLIRERGLHEARILLQRTTLSAERIAAMLGFSSASQFNHFFKSMSNETPGAFRARITGRSPEPGKAVPMFSDWP